MKRKRYGALRPDKTIDPAAYVVTESGCHQWLRFSSNGLPMANFEGRPVSVRHWLKNLTYRAKVVLSCGNTLCVNQDHFSQLIPKPVVHQKQLDAHQRHVAEELAKSPDEIRRLLYVREDIARLLALIPEGVITERDREGLRRYADGAFFSEIAGEWGCIKQVVQYRLIRADRVLRREARMRLDAGEPDDRGPAAS